MDKNSPVYTLTNECHDCYKCIRECPVKAIKIENGHASVLSKKCIACGNCVKACPSNAKRVRYDIDKVKNLLLAQKKVYVSLAPSWSGVFDYSKEKFIAILKKLGFEGVSETALGAQEVSIQTAKTLNESDKGLFVSSACPVIVDYIRKYNPEYTDKIVELASPALTHAKMLKKEYGDSISVVFLGPCVAKKNESDEHKNLIDAAMTFEELKVWIADEAIDISSITAAPQDKFIPEEAFEGSLYPLDGGMNETIRKVGVKNGVQLLNICSLNAFERALKGLDTKNLGCPIFIEALACDGGCIAGPCISCDDSGIKIMSNVLKRTKTRDKIPEIASEIFEKQYAKQCIETKEFTPEEIASAMKTIGKTSAEDELNCGGCGYSTCKELACALITGDAETSMCVSYMRKIAMQKAAAMLRCMPSATVIVDKDLKIVETNDSFMKMFCSDMYEIFANRKDGLLGASLDRIVNLTDIFKTALKSGKDVHKERFPINDKLYDISAFTIEKNIMVGAIITDVTKTELNRGKIAQKAQDVISKNITIVQDIACLLGEHMVETEMILSSIAQDYDNEEEG